MFQKMNVLQLGGEDLSKKYSLPSGMSWFLEPDLRMVGKSFRAGSGNGEEIALDPEKVRLAGIYQFDAAIIGRPLDAKECSLVNQKVRSYSLFVMSSVPKSPEIQGLLASRHGEVVPDNDLEKLILHRLPNFYSASYGEKCRRQEFIPVNARGRQIEYSGYRGITMRGNFGEQFAQAGFWKTNIPLFPEETVELWLEFEKDDTIELEAEAAAFAVGSVETIADRWEFSEEQIASEHCLCIYNDSEKQKNLFVFLKAKGRGTLRVIDLHTRWGRNGEGYFLPGGERAVTSSREEAFFYFDPGDRKPPLNVYFSGYKTKEGFEGYRMMRNLGSPFLLVADQRLEGGSFYLGSEEYEAAIRNRILRALHELNFTSADLILSGISMGTTGAMYYGAQLSPAYVILGKPLASLGSMAEAERIDRPGGFPTSLDLLGKTEGGLEEQDVANMNERFWHVFRFGDWSATTFLVAYMIEDDYDRTAYEHLLTGLNRAGTRVIGKGLHGRHNDDTVGIVRWYVKQYETVLREHYQRTKDEEAG